jgi:hypothetical protein
MSAVSFKFSGRTRKGLTVAANEDGTRKAVLFRMKVDGKMTDVVEWFDVDTLS